MPRAYLLPQSLFWGALTKMIDPLFFWHMSTPLKKLSPRDSLFFLGDLKKDPKFCKTLKKGNHNFGQKTLIFRKWYTITAYRKTPTWSFVTERPHFFVCVWHITKRPQSALSNISSFPPPYPDGLGNMQRKKLEKLSFHIFRVTLWVAAFHIFRVTPMGGCLPHFSCNSMGGCHLRLLSQGHKLRYFQESLPILNNALLQLLLCFTC